MEVDTLFINATILSASGKDKQDQALAVREGRIAWCGPMSALSSDYLTQAKQIEDCKGTLLTPGLINCHTHLVYAGDRLQDYKARLKGMSYAAIAEAGGGIWSTVLKTRAATEEELIATALPRLFAMREEGVTTVEIKSGYGLDFETEFKLLKVARSLAPLCGLRIQTTFLGAHAIPPEYKQRPETYVDFLCKEVLPRIAEAKLADAVDVFSESIAFNLNQTESIFECAQGLNLPVKCHAEQLSNIGASQLAAQFGALSCDHLEYLALDGVKAMAKQGTVGVLLPGAYYFLSDQKKPPVSLMREWSVPMAIATDSNPGSSPTVSLLLMMSMACQLFGLTIEEAWRGVTFCAAKALGMETQIGQITAGHCADLVHWPVYESASLVYHFGHPHASRSMVNGEWLN